MLQPIGLVFPFKQAIIPFIIIILLKGHNRPSPNPLLRETNVVVKKASVPSATVSDMCFSCFINFKCVAFAFRRSKPREYLNYLIFCYEIMCHIHYLVFKCYVLVTLTSTWVQSRFDKTRTQHTFF